MRDIFRRIRRAGQGRARRLWWLTFALAPCLLVLLPVVGRPGYELATALALWSGLAGLTISYRFGAAGRVAPSPWRDAIAAALSLVGLLVPSVVTSSLVTRLTSRCDPLFGGEWLVTVTLPSAVLAGAVGVFLGARTSTRVRGLLGGFALVLLSALSTTWTIVFGPHVYAYNHFGGYLPGPLYDEVISVPSALLWFRVATLLLAACFVELADLRRPLRPVLLAAAFLTIEWSGTKLGFRTSDASLSAALGGVVTTDHVVLHYPEGTSPEQRERIVGDVEFRYLQLARFFGETPPGRVTVWWYASAEEKQRLVGAEHTQFAKPWRREVHVNAYGFPHPVLKHELVHAMASVWGAAPFGVTATWGGLNPNPGIIEGLAVAADDPADDLTLHEWAAAMKKKDLLPDVASLFEGSGFFAAPASRAYATAGSFMHWLQETRGAQKLRALYRTGDFRAQYGADVHTLAAEYVAFLDAVPLNAQAVNQAFGRFRRGGVFDRPCAREVALLTDEAQRDTEEHPTRALALYARCRALQPEEPSLALARARVLLARGDTTAARDDFERLTAKLDEAPSAYADAALALVQLELDEGHDAAARTVLEKLVRLEISPSIDRTARVRLHALESPPAVRAAIDAYFAKGSDAAKVLELEQAASDDVFVSYLLGRKLHGVEAHARALPYLLRALTDAPDSLRLEAHRLALESAAASHDCAQLESLAGAAPISTTASTARAADLVERCRFVTPRSNVATPGELR